MEEWCCVSGRRGCRLLWYILLPLAPGLRCCHRSYTTVHPLSSYSKLDYKMTTSINNGHLPNLLTLTSSQAKLKGYGCYLFFLISRNPVQPAINRFNVFVAAASYSCAVELY